MMQGMRVLVATDTIGSLSSARAGTLLATGWADGDVTVVPLGEAGAGFAVAAADQLGAALVTTAVEDCWQSIARQGGTAVVAVEYARLEAPPDLPLTASSAGLGHAVRHVLQEPAGRPQRLLVDLTGPAAHDGGAGFLAALGATADVALDQGVAELSGLSRLDLAPARSLLTGVDLVGVVPMDEVARPLLGLRGITSLRRTSTMDPALLLDTDAALTTFAQVAASHRASAAGAGACGGLGFAVLALGGRLVTGPAYALESNGARSAVATAELVVTGCTEFDFARRGGGVVAEAARVAGEQLAPCIAVAVEVLIGGRELRTLGIESAYPVRERTPTTTAAGDVTEVELIALARRVGRSWRW